MKFGQTAYKSFVLTNWDGFIYDGGFTGPSSVRCRDTKLKWTASGIQFIKSKRSGVQGEVVLGEARVFFVGVHVDYFHVVCGGDVWWCVVGRVPANGECILNARGH